MSSSTHLQVDAELQWTQGSRVCCRLILHKSGQQRSARGSPQQPEPAAGTAAGAASGGSRAPAAAHSPPCPTMRWGCACATPHCQSQHRGPDRSPATYLHLSSSPCMCICYLLLKTRLPSPTMSLTTRHPLINLLSCPPSGFSRTPEIPVVHSVQFLSLLCFCRRSALHTVHGGT